MTVKDGGRPPLSTSGQLTIIIDNYDTVATGEWHTLAAKSVSSFLSWPLAGLQLAVVVTVVTATILLVAILVLSLVVARRNRKRKYIVNGDGSGNIGEVGLQAQWCSG